MVFNVGDSLLMEYATTISIYCTSIEPNLNIQQFQNT